MAGTIDFKKTLATYRAPRGRFEIVDVPELRYLMVDGHGDPNTSPAFGDAVQAVYPVAYGLKMTSKRELGRDYVVPPLEGLWWADDPTAFTSARDKSAWSWTVLMMVPDWIGSDLLDTAVTRAAAKDGRSPRVQDIRMETLAEGTCVQTLHIGSFDDETGVLARLHDEFIPAHRLRMTGRHHEIYLSDFRRTEPAERRTILRQPVTAATEP